MRIKQIEKITIWLKSEYFISFDYDNDEGAKIMLAGQAKLPSIVHSILLTHP